MKICVPFNGYNGLVYLCFYSTDFSLPVLAAKVADNFIFFDLQISKGTALLPFVAPILLLCFEMRKCQILNEDASGGLFCSCGWDYSSFTFIFLL